MVLRKRIQTRFLEDLLATPRGRAHVLNTAGDAENADEAHIFELLLERVDDPELVQLIRRHQEDEVRHASMFFDCVRRQGVEPYPVPPEQQIITRLAELTGEIDVKDRLGVMRAYVLLQVIEERAVTQFALMEPVLRRFDRESADVMRAIARATSSTATPWPGVTPPTRRRTRRRSPITGPLKRAHSRRTHVRTCDTSSTAAWSDANRWQSCCGAAWPPSRPGTSTRKGPPSGASPPGQTVSLSAA
jgi:hypothetical protein